MVNIQFLRHSRKMKMLLFTIFGLYAEIRVAISGHPNNLDPLNSTDANSQNINRLVHRSLVDFDKNMRLICDLCENFKEDFSSGYKVLFNLKKNSCKGEEVTSKDVQDSLRAFQSKKSIFRFAFNKIEMEILDKYSFFFKYDDYQLEHLSNLPLLKIFKEGKNCGKYNLNVENSSYYLKGKDLPTLEFVVVRDETTLALKLINKEIDMAISNMGPRKYFWLKKNYSKDLKFLSSPSINIRFISFNTKREKLKDPKVRELLSALVPLDDLIRYKLKGEALKSQGLFSPVFKDFVYLKKNDKSIIKKIDEILPKKEGVRLKLDWKMSSDRFNVEWARLIAHEFKKYSIILQVNPMEWGSYYKSYKDGNFDMATGSWVGMAGPEMLYTAFHSDSFPPKGLNRGSFSNSESDKLLTQAIKETDKEKRNKLFIQAQKVLYENFPYIFLWHPHTRWIVRKCLTVDLPYPNGSIQPMLTMVDKCN